MSEVETKLWFKRRRYGWGWTPVTWQGWLSLLLFLSIVIVLPFLLFPLDETPVETAKVVLYVLFVISALFILIGICFMKGPIPRWRWGKTPTDDPKTDF